MKSKRASHQKQPDPPATSLILCNPEDLRREMQQVQLAIAHRAYELFDSRGREHGHDVEDWLRAQSELLQPVSISMSESVGRINIRADVAGFDDTELKVSIEPHRITILGQKEMKAEGIEPTSSRPQQILEVVDLTTPVAPERAVVKLQGEY